MGPLFLGEERVFCCARYYPPPWSSAARFEGEGMFGNDEDTGTLRECVDDAGVRAASGSAA